MRGWARGNTSSGQVRSQPRCTVSPGWGCCLESGGPNPAGPPSGGLPSRRLICRMRWAVRVGKGVPGDPVSAPWFVQPRAGAREPGAGAGGPGSRGAWEPGSREPGSREPGSRGAGSQGAGSPGEVSRQLAASLAAAGAGNMGRAAIYQPALERLRAALSGAAPAAERSPPPQAPAAGMEKLSFP